MWQHYELNVCIHVAKNSAINLVGTLKKMTERSNAISHWHNGISLNVLDRTVWLIYASYKQSRSSHMTLMFNILQSQKNAVAVL